MDGSPISPKKYKAVTNVPAKAYYANYMNSPVYKKRLEGYGINEVPDVQRLLNTPITFNN